MKRLLINSVQKIFEICAYKEVFKKVHGKNGYCGKKVMSSTLYQNKLILISFCTNFGCTPHHISLWQKQKSNIH